MTNISDCLDDIRNKLDDADNISDNVYEFCIRKLNDANKYVEEMRYVLQSITE